MGVGAAIAGAAVLGAGASVYGSEKASSAAKKSTGVQQNMFDATQKNLQPFIPGASANFNTYNAMLQPGQAPGPGSGSAPVGNQLTGQGGPTPGMLAAMSGPSHQAGNDTAIMDIGNALKLGRTITDDQWRQAGFGPGGIDPNAPQGNPMTSAPGAPGGGMQDRLDWLSQTPGYQFQLQQGLKGVQNGYAARGLGSSGAAMKGAADYSEGLAGTYYGNYMNQLLQGAQLGANSAAGLGGIAQNTAGNIGNSMMNGANAQWAGLSGAANSLGNGLTGYYALRGQQNAPPVTSGVGYGSEYGNMFGG